MDRDKFARIVEEALAAIPAEFRKRLENVVVLVEDRPAARRMKRGPRRPGQRQKLVLGVFEGVPRTMKSVFNLPTGPDRIVLYQRNIEAVCRSEAEIREEIRLTVIHELGHYFGMDEDQLKDV
jgi:predicted Zn-dependent protease with MMP-like domain